MSFLSGPQEPSASKRDTRASVSLERGRRTEGSRCRAAAARGPEEEAAARRHTTAAHKEKDPRALYTRELHKKRRGGGEAE